MKISKLINLWLLFLVLMAVFLKTGITFADESKYTVEILDYGICTTKTTNSFQDPRNATKSLDTTNIRFLKKTDKVEGKIEVEFGILYKIHGPSEPRKVPGQHIWIFPKAMTNPKNNRTSQRAARDFSYTLEENWHSAYSFDNDWEIIPGVWRVEIWVAGQKLAEKSFTVTIPQ
jgi:hypothetical protein